jgi:hypothetical protein
MDIPDIDKIMKRTARYACEDGIGEMFYGAVFMLLGLLFFLEATLNPPIPWFSVIGFLVLVYGGFLLGRWLVPALKRRLTYPRTGFVAYRQLSAGRRWMVMGIAALVAVFVTGIFAVAARVGGTLAVLEWIPLCNGLVVGAFLLYLGFELGLRRFMLLSGFSGLAGVAAFLAGMGATLGTAAYFAAMGLALSVCGALALRAYLRGAPRAEEQ